MIEKQTFRSLLAYALFACIITICIAIAYTANTNAATAAVGGNFSYYFKIDGNLRETGSSEESSSPYFWVNSGGALKLEGGTGKTVQGKLPFADPFRLLYALTNALDTGGGYYPQNIFRLVTKNSWSDFAQSVRFNVAKTNLTNTPNRGDYSGILLFNRYKDGDNLYYAGVRFDGDAVIKKKYKGTYYTLGSAEVFQGGTTASDPNLIPENTWMRMKSIVRSEGQDAVLIELWVDKTDKGEWKKVLSVVDTKGQNGSDIIRGSGHAGIRTDYMDVVFDDFKVEEI